MSPLPPQQQPASGTCLHVVSGADMCLRHRLQQVWTAQDAHTPSEDGVDVNLGVPAHPELEMDRPSLHGGGECAQHAQAAANSGYAHSLMQGESKALAGQYDICTAAGLMPQADQVTSFSGNILLWCKGASDKEEEEES